MSLTSRLLGVRAAPTAATTPRTTTPGAATANIAWTAPNTPMQALWDADAALSVGYYGHIYHYRCIRTIATTVAGLPFRVGPDPDKPGAWNPNAPLARLLGPPPGGPTPNISPRQLWVWSIVSYLATGRWAWETPHPPGMTTPSSLWPLVAAKLFPVTSDRPGEWFSRFEYQLNAQRRILTPDQVFYAWRPSQNDWRQPESSMQAMALPTQMAVALDRFMVAFMRNNMVGSKLVITPGFDDAEMRRAFQDQFLAEMTGADNAGRTAFAEYVDDSGDSKTPAIQVADLGTKPVDAQLMELQSWVRDTICNGWGVPVSIVGQAAERTYENADQEHRNYWTGTVLEVLKEVQDLVNVNLAPRFGDDVGWFDLSGVEALKPAHRFTQISAKDAVDSQIATVGEVRQDMALPAVLPTEPDAPEVDPVPAIDDTPGATSIGPTTGTTLRADGRQVDASRVLAYLADNYPQRVLGWVKQARWERRDAPLTDIKLARRPGGRDFAKVEAITQAIKDGRRLDPVVLVDTGEAKLEVADGYHRLLAYDRAGVKTVDAYVGSGVGRHGPWEQEMHDAKLNRSDPPCPVHGDRAGVCTGPGPCDTTPLGLGKNWVTKAGGLPAYIRAVAHAMRRKGETESQAIEKAVGIIQNWASGQGHVTAATRARAAAALAEWEALKAKAHAQRDDPPGLLTESSSAGSLLPVANGAALARHLPTRSGTRGVCGTCGRPVKAPVHGTGRRKRRNSQRGFDPEEPRDPDGKWAAVGADLEKLAAKAKAGGFSVNIGTGQPPTAGYMIAYTGHTGRYDESILDQPEALKAAYRTWLKQHRAFLTPDKYVGGWVDSGMFWLEPAENELDLDAALRKGRDRDQISIYDVANDDYLETGGSGGISDAPIEERQASVLPAGSEGHAVDDRRGDRRLRRPDSRRAVRARRPARRQGLDEALALIAAHERHAGAGHHPVKTGHYSGARRAVAQVVDEQAAAMEPALERAVRGVFTAQRKATVDRLAGKRGKQMLRAASDSDQTGEPAPLIDATQIFDYQHWLERTRAALDPFYAAIGAAGQPRLARFPSTAATRKAVTDALTARSVHLAQTVTRTTLDQIQAALAKGVTEGQSIAQMAAAINQVFDDADSARAALIARTEAIGAINTAADAHAAALGPQVVAGKEWIATHDPRTRPTHAAADGQVRAMTVPFTVGGFPMEHPGDPTAPPDEVCNCRCTTGYLTPAEYARRTGQTLPAATPPIAA